jgi:hypothetical protein
MKRNNQEKLPKKLEIDNDEEERPKPRQRHRGRTLPSYNRLITTKTKSNFLLTSRHTRPCYKPLKRPLEKLNTPPYILLPAAFPQEAKTVPVTRDQTKPSPYGA